jgi:hypothetical protein
MRRLDAGEREQLDHDVTDLAWTWARRILELGGDEPPFSEYESMRPEREREVRLAQLAAYELLRTELDSRARDIARLAAAAGADYGDLGDAVGMTRQGARRRWPGLADLTKAAREQAGDPPPFEAELYVPNAAAGAIVGHLVDAGHTGREAVQGREGVHIGLANRQAAEQLRDRLVAAGYRPSEVR